MRLLRDMDDDATDVIAAVGLTADGAPGAGDSASQPGHVARLVADIRVALASYRLRIVAWFVMLLTLGTVATILVVGQLLVQRIGDGIRADLVQEVDEFRALAGGLDPETSAPFGTNVTRMFDVFMARNVPNRHETMAAFVDGHLYARSSTVAPYAIGEDPGFVAAVANTSETVAGHIESPVGTVEYLAVPVRADGRTLGVFVAAGFPDLARAEQEEIILAALAVGIAVLLIGSLLAWRLADRLLAPVSQTAATARAISETDLSQRVEARGYDEVATLARTFNDMLDRLETAFAGQRRFLDDAGHELRTPLTIVRGHLELLDEGTPGEREKSRQLILDELDRMARLVNELIMLAEATRPDFLRRQLVDAGPLARQVHEKASVLAERDWRLSVRREGTVSCDPQRVTQTLLQLAANAVEHTQSGGQVEVGVDVGDQEARFWVADDGAGVPRDEREQIFERFYRGRPQPRTTGAGLGLSIVRAIAQAHGGRAFVEPAGERGARFVVALPR